MRMQMLVDVVGELDAKAGPLTEAVKHLDNGIDVDPIVEDARLGPGVPRWPGVFGGDKAAAVWPELATNDRKALLEVTADVIIERFEAITT